MVALTSSVHSTHAPHARAYQKPHSKGSASACAGTALRRTLPDMRPAPHRQACGSGHHNSQTREKFFFWWRESGVREGSRRLGNTNKPNPIPCSRACRLIDVNVIERHIQDETDNIDADEECVDPEEAVINSSCLIFDHANDGWSNDKAYVLDGCGNSESCSDTGWRNHVWD